MLANGSKIPHVRSSNFISEMVDSFNVTAVQTNAGVKLAIIVGRDMVSIEQETMVQHPHGFVTEARPEDVKLVRHVVANLTVPLENAKSLISALQTTIARVEEEQAKQGGSDAP